MPVNYGFIPQSTQVSAQIQNAATNTGRQMAEQKMQLGQLWGNAFQQAGDAFGNAILQPAMLKYQQRMQDAQRTAEQNWWKDQFALRTAGKTWDEWQPELEKAGGLQQWQLANEIDAQSMLQNAELANRELSQIRMARMQQMIAGPAGGMQQRGSAGAGVMESDYGKLYELGSPQQQQQIDQLTSGIDDITFEGPTYAALDRPQRRNQLMQMSQQRDAIYKDIMRKNPQVKQKFSDELSQRVAAVPGHDNLLAVQQPNGTIDFQTIKPAEKASPVAQRFQEIMSLPPEQRTRAMQEFDDWLTPVDQNTGATKVRRFDSNGNMYFDKLADQPKQSDGEASANTQWDQLSDRDIQSWIKMVPDKVYDENRGKDVTLMPRERAAMAQNLRDSLHAKPILDRQGEDLLLKKRNMAVPSELTPNVMQLAHQFVNEVAAKYKTADVEDFSIVTDEYDRAMIVWARRVMEAQQGAGQQSLPVGK